MTRFHVPGFVLEPSESETWTEFYLFAVGSPDFDSVVECAEFADYSVTLFRARFVK